MADDTVGPFKLIKTVLNAAKVAQRFPRLTIVATHLTSLYVLRDETVDACEVWKEPVGFQVEY